MTIFFFLLLFPGKRGVEQTAAGEQDDYDPDRGGDHVLRVPDAHGRYDAHGVRVRAAREDARVLREPRPAHHLQLSDGGERRVQLHAVLRHEPQIPAHAHGHVYAVPGGPARATRHSPIVRQLPEVRHHCPAQHRGHADDGRRVRRQTRTAHPGQQVRRQQERRRRRQRDRRTLSSARAPKRTSTQDRI